MRYSSPADGNKRKINTKECFVDSLNSRNPLDIPDFNTILDKSEDLAKSEFGPTSEAIGNSRGAWYEWLLTVGAMNFCNDTRNNYLLISLPNITSFDFADLYFQKVRGLISDLRKKAEFYSDVSLITSNPDYCIIRKPDWWEPIEMETIDENTLEELDSLYNRFREKCSFTDIVGYLSVKTSLRPDRRLQLAHEGSLMKAIYKHIQTRTWEIGASGLKYYAATMTFNKSDKKALSTLATHSLIDVNTKPESAVDKLFEITTGDQLRKLLDEISP